MAKVIQKTKQKPAAFKTPAGFGFVEERESVYDIGASVSHRKPGQPLRLTACPGVFRLLGTSTFLDAFPELLVFFRTFKNETHV